MSSNSDNMTSTTNQEQFQQVSKKFKKPYKKRNSSDASDNHTSKPKLSFKELLFELNNLKKYKHSPKADLFERNNSYVIKMELPGLTQNDITVQLRDSQFVLVSGHKHNLVNQSDDTIIYSECFYGNFMRRVKVPQPVSKESMTLSMSDGVLVLTFTKLPQVEETLDSRLEETSNTQTLEPIPEGKVLDFSTLGDFKSTSWADEI
jgi:HSP20 family molecular chaperone IbpA